MTMTYIVHSHVGGEYLTTDAPDRIEATCPQCGDHDDIIGSYGSDDDAEEIGKVALVAGLNALFVPLYMSLGAVADGYDVSFGDLAADACDEIDHYTGDVLDDGIVDGNVDFSSLPDGTDILRLAYDHEAGECADWYQGIEGHVPEAAAWMRANGGRYLTELSRRIGLACDGSGDDRHRLSDTLVERATASLRDWCKNASSHRTDGRLDAADITETAQACFCLPWMSDMSYGPNHSRMNAWESRSPLIGVITVDMQEAYASTLQQMMDEYANA